MKTFFLLTSLFLSLNSVALTCIDRGPNVILFTWDGIRNQEFFRGTGWLLETKLPKEERGEVLNEFWRTHAPQGLVLGGNNRYMIGSRVSVSLPSYQAIMVGKPTECRKNNCEAVTEETLPESLRTNLKLDKKDIAAFASWNRIIAAIAKDPSQITHGIFPEKFDDGTNDEVFKKLHESSLTDLPSWHGSRKDKYTFDIAHHYLKKHCPRFLYISLVDSDEFAHKGDYKGYVNSIRTYDDYLNQLIKTLDSLGDYGKNTTLLVTTDHSRGAGPLWRGHGHTTMTEKNVFLFARGRGVSPQGRTKDKGNHLLLRPTIEALMGINHSKTTLPGINTSPE